MDQTEVADMAAGSPKMSKPMLEEEDLVDPSFVATAPPPESAGVSSAELPLPTTPPGELSTGLVTELKAPKEKAERMDNGPRSFAQAEKAERKAERWAPTWLRGKRWDALNAELSEVPLIIPLAHRFQVAPVVVGMGFLVLAITFLLYGIGGQLVCTVFGIAYPAFESFKAVEEFANLKDSDEIYRKAAGMQFWLTYWIVVAAITSFECLFYYVVVWIPFYYPLKLGTLLYLYAPRIRGANHVYNWCVSPVLKRNRETIDHTLEDTGKRLRKSVSNVASSAVDAGFGVGKQGVAQLRGGMTMVRHFVGSEIARRRSGAASPAAVSVVDTAAPGEAPGAPVSVDTAVTTSAEE